MADAPFNAANTPAAWIRSLSMNFLIAGVVCLWMGWSRGADAPGSATPEQAQFWFGLDNAANTALLAIGAAFVLAAAGTAAGNRVAAVLGICADVALGLLAVALAVMLLAEGRLDGRWDVFALLYALVSIVCFVAAAQKCSVLARAGRAAPVAPPA